MPMGDLYLDADGQTARLLCRRCGRVWSMPASCVETVLRVAWPRIVRQHTECCADRVSPDDEAWLREALRDTL